MSERQPAENDARLTAAERAVLHAPHAVPINLDWQTCPLCSDYVDAAEAIIAERAAEAWERCAKEAHDLGWLHDWALSDLLARNPWCVIPPARGHDGSE